MAMAIPRETVMNDETKAPARRGSNPALKAGVFSRAQRREGDGVMTLTGAVNKSGLLLLFLAGGFALTYAPTLSSVDNPWMALLLPLIVVNFILALVIIFKPRSAPFLAPVYAMAEGLVLGCLSAVFEAKYPGIAFDAAGLTFGTLAVLLAIYATGMIRPSENFKLGVMAATGGVAVLYAIDLVLMFFGHPVPMIHETGWLGIGFSAVVVVIAALNLILDFDFIEQGVAQEAPRYMEWYAAFSLMLTLVWLYLEILRLLSKLNKK
jgi:uncharacterized YccA/Bax inhibitor family protein